MSSSLRVLCVVSDILGNRILGDIMLASLAKIENADICAIRLRPEDYHRYAAPRWTKMSPSIEALAVLRAKLEREVHGSFDLIVVTTWVGAIAVRALAKVSPTCASMDQVPSNAADVTVLRTSSRLRRLLKRAMWRVHHYAFSRVAREIDLFLPLTPWVRDALVRSYGIRPDRCYVTFAPQDLTRWKPGVRSRSVRLRLLFVGSNFELKGGELLLEMYRTHLSHIATLTIATLDPLAPERIPAGVEVLSGRGRDELLEVYQGSDLFIYPTRQDMMPLVLSEALATGLPCIATDIAAVSDLITDGENGFLMPYDASAAEWAAKVRFLHERRDVLDAYASRARRFAESHLDLEKFDSTVAKVVEQLRAGKLLPH